MILKHRNNMKDDNNCKCKYLAPGNALLQSIGFSLALKVKLWFNVRYIDALDDDA